MSSLIAKLNANAHRNPDEIAAALVDPFAKWRLGRTLTSEEYEQHRDRHIVLLNTERRRTPDHAESNCHTLRRSDGGCQWTYRGHWQSWLGREYYFRSQESYDADPTDCPA